MSFPELVFYCLAALSVLVMFSVFTSILSGRRKSAWMALRAYLVVLAIYGTVLLATTLAQPVRTLPIGEPQYSGDWSITPFSLRRVPMDLDEDYQIDFRLANRSKSPLGGPKGLTVYLLNEDGTRYDSAPAISEPPFDVVVRPGKWVTTTRKFSLPTNLNRVELVIVQQGLRLGWFLIGRRPFDGRTVTVLQ